LISWMESTSWTFLAVGWLPKDWWSPERQRTLLIPRLRAPKRSLCSAMRLRSRTVICIMGSPPAWRTCTPAAILDKRTIAVWLSGQVHDIDIVLQQGDVFFDAFGINMFRRSDFATYQEVSPGKNFFHFAAGFQSILTSSRTTLRGPPSRDLDQSLGGWISMRRSNLPRACMRS